jgi:15-cis-phytoene synthase
MTIYAQNWEKTLLTWAIEPLLEQVGNHTLPSSNILLDKAYEHCKHITQYHSRTFHMASRLLPAEKQRAVHALYAMCRITDDIVDRAEEMDSNPLATLDDWYARLSRQKATIHHPVILAWADAKARFRIPQSYVRQLVDGVAMDMQQMHYQTFDDLAKYSYGVASTVGLMAMHIIGYDNEDAIPYAVKLGVALQITNILRDVGDDWRSGRVYLPQDELDAFGASDALRKGQVTDNWREFMRFQIDRNRQLYTESLPGIQHLNTDGRFAIAAAAELYQAILSDIEANDYDVFTRRARVSTSSKLGQLPAIWWRNNRRASTGT